MLSSDTHPVLSQKGVLTSNGHNMLSDIAFPMPAGISLALFPSSQLTPAASLPLLMSAAQRAHAATARSGCDGAHASAGCCLAVKFYTFSE